MGQANSSKQTQVAANLAFESSSSAIIPQLQIMQNCNEMRPAASCMG